MNANGRELGATSPRPSPPCDDGEGEGKEERMMTALPRDGRRWRRLGHVAAPRVGIVNELAMPGRPACAGSYGAVDPPALAATARWIAVARVTCGFYARIGNCGFPGSWKADWRGRDDWCQPREFVKFEDLMRAVECRCGIAGLECLGVASWLPAGPALAFGMWGVIRESWLLALVRRTGLGTRLRWRRGKELTAKNAEIAESKREEVLTTDGPAYAESFGAARAGDLQE